MAASSPSILTHTDTLLPPTLPLLATGKVRDLYKGDGVLLFVATDRISAFDVTLSNGIPNKGRLLTLLSAFWISLLERELPKIKTHFLSLDLPASIPSPARSTLQDRTMIVQQCKVFPIEAIVRGYLTGSAWKEYQQKGTVHGMALASGISESGRIPGGPLFTPSTKAPPGESDVNISKAQAAEIVGAEYAAKIEELALSIYMAASKYAEAKGIIIADTKFEFGLDESGEVVLIDEILTPDSSRFWDKDKYTVGQPQASLDKQPLRDYLADNSLKGKLDVVLPDEVVDATASRYREAYERIVGKAFETSA